MEYTKPFLTFEQQADQLIDRGMNCDRCILIEHLKDIGYYRLSGYWHVYKREDNTFEPDTEFEKVWNLYTFDRQFRLVVLDAIERVEVYFRTQLAYKLAEQSGPFGFLDNENLPRLSVDRYEKFIRKSTDAIERSREPFIIHFKAQYGDSHALPPYWMLVNTMDFGMMLTLYRGASVEIRNSISGELGVSSRVLDSWLVTLNTVRNICAHHGRLWNRTLGTAPMIPNRENDNRWHEPIEIHSDRVFCVLTILSYLLLKVAPETKWRTRLFNLISQYPDLDTRKMGFPTNWRESPFW